MADLRGMDSNISVKALHQQLKGSRYNLRDGGNLGQTCDEGITPPGANDVTQYQAIPSRKGSVVDNLAIALVALLLTTLLAVILYYFKNSADNGLERFMDSQGLGVRAMMMIPGLLLKTYWQYLYRGTYLTWV